ncbi:MAG: insulinase family protein [Gemmatimonadetes bacterium]|nr:insulinase family protein [Gemmatimonadota bacterium]
MNHRPEKRAELRLAVNAGSVLEDDNQRGIAHFVEHMAFNGTRNFARQELVSYLESIGMRFGADLNAYTSFDETIYMLTVPTDTGTFLQRGVEILRDWADGQLFDSAEVERERGVVIEEWRLGRGAESRMQDKQFPVLFQGSRYAERLPIGVKAQLEKYTASDLRRFYQRWYRPDLMAVIAVGEFDPKAVERLIRERFASMPKTQDPRPRPVYPVPPHSETLVAIATDPEATSSRASVYYKQPLRFEKTVGDYRQSLVERLYSSMFNDRFFEMTQKPDAPFLYASTGQGRFVRSGEIYLLSAGVKDGGIEQGLDALVTEAERVARYGFTATELKRAKADLLRGLESAYAERDKSNSANYVSELTRAFLESEPVPGIEEEYRLAQELVPGITVAEINGLARAWMVDRNRVILANEPEKTGLAVPTPAQLLAVLNGAANKTVEAYQDLATDAPLVGAAPRGSAIVEEKTIPELGVREWHLANGVRVVLKPTDFKNDEILMDAWSPGGSSLAPDSIYIPASTASMVVGQGGVGQLSVVDLQKSLAGKDVGVHPVIGSLSEGLSGSASPKDITTLFQLVYLYFTAPRRDSSAFLAMQQQIDAMLQDRALSPSAAYQDTLQVTLAQHHFRARPMTAEVFRQMSLDRSLAFYRDRFADASDFIFFFVGSFNPDSLKPLVQTWLGSLPSISRKETWRDVGIRPPAGVVKKAVYRGVEPQSQTQVIFTGAAEYNRQSRYAVRSLGDVLQIRLRDRMREDLSGTYGVSVRANVSRDPTPQYSVSIGFGSAPERVDELVKAVFEEIQKLKDVGATETDIAKVKETQRRTRETSMRQNGFWLGQLEVCYREGIDPRDLLTYERLIDSLNPVIVREAARKYLPADNYVQASLFPEKPKS